MEQNTIVKCLKELATKVTPTIDVKDIDADTICKVLCYINDNFNVDNKVKNISNLFSIEGITGNITTNISNVYVKKVADLYNVRVVVNFNVTQTTSTNSNVVFKLILPDEVLHFGGAVGAGFIVDTDTSSKNQPCTVQICGEVNEKCDCVVRSVTPIQTGNYLLNADFMIAQGVK